jgi:hypothetical protein
VLAQRSGDDGFRIVTLPMKQRPRFQPGLSPFSRLYFLRLYFLRLYFAAANNTNRFRLTGKINCFLCCFSPPPISATQDDETGSFVSR